MDTKDFNLDLVGAMTTDELMAMVTESLGENATQEEIQDAVLSIFDEFRKTFSKPYTLKLCLSFLLKDDLVEIMKALGFSHYSKMRKDELAEYLHEVLLDANYMRTVYPSLTDGEVDMLNTLCSFNIPLVSTDIMFSATDLLRHGLCYMDEHGKHLVFPEELKQAFLSAQSDPKLVQKQKHYSTIYNICSASVYLYGAYPISDLLSKIQLLTGAAMTEQSLMHWHTVSAMHREEFFFKNNYIVSTALQQTPEDVVALQQIQKMKKQFFWPTSGQMKEFSKEQWLIDEKWYEPFWALETKLMDNEFGDIFSVSRFVEASIRTGAPFDALMGFLSEQIFAFDSYEEVDGFIKIMQDIWDNTPMWENCGYSPHQLKSISHKQDAAKKSSSGKVISLAEHRAKKNK